MDDHPIASINTRIPAAQRAGLIWDRLCEGAVSCPHAPVRGSGHRVGQPTAEHELAANSGPEGSQPARRARATAAHVRRGRRSHLKMSELFLPTPSDSVRFRTAALHARYLPVFDANGPKPPVGASRSLPLSCHLHPAVPGLECRGYSAERLRADLRSTATNNAVITKTVSRRRRLIGVLDESASKANQEHVGNSQCRSEGCGILPWSIFDTTN